MRAQIQNRLVTEAPFRSFSFQDQTTGMHSVSVLPVGTPCQQCTARPPEDRRWTLTAGCRVPPSTLLLRTLRLKTP
jgi:hypothetical protein